MKKYIPKEMIAKSRFKDYYAKWSSDEQKRLLEIMERLIRGISQMRERRFYYDNPQVHLPADIQQIRYARNDGDILQGGRYYVQRPAPCGVYLLRADRQGRKYVRLYF